MNIAHMLASRLSLPTMGAGGWAFGGPVGAAAGLAGNLLFRKGMEHSTKKAVNRALATVLAGKGAQQKAVAGDKKAMAEALARILLSVEGARVGAETPSYATAPAGR